MLRTSEENLNECILRYEDGSTHIFYCFDDKNFYRKYSDLEIIEVNSEDLDKPLYITADKPVYKYIPTTISIEIERLFGVVEDEIDFSAIDLTINRAGENKVINFTTSS